MRNLAYFLVLVVTGIIEAEGRGHNPRFPAFAAGNKIPPPPPISMPVWSLACPIVSSSPDTVEKETSMNIVTSATPVSVEPPKLWVVSLYYNTLTHQSMNESGFGVLQLLTPKQKDLVPILGKQSGYQEGVSKRKDCAKLGYEWFKHRSDNAKGQESFLSQNGKVLESLDLLPNCASYVLLRLLSTTPAGDHEVALCQVEGTGVWDEATRQVVQIQVSQPIDSDAALYTGLLRKEGII